MNESTFAKLLSIVYEFLHKSSYPNLVIMKNDSYIDNEMIELGFRNIDIYLVASRDEARAIYEKMSVNYQSHWHNETDRIFGKL